MSQKLPNSRLHSTDHASLAASSRKPSHETNAQRTGDAYPPRRVRRALTIFALAFASLSGCADLGQECQQDSDCFTGSAEFLCAEERCHPALDVWCTRHDCPALCTNGKLDPMEEYADCGGPCAPCTPVDRTTMATIEAQRGVWKNFTLPPLLNDDGDTFTLVNESEHLALVDGKISWLPTSRDLVSESLTLVLRTSDGTESVLVLPIAVREPRVEKVATGIWHTCALIEGGRVRCFGFAEHEISPRRLGEALPSPLGYDNPVSTKRPLPAGIQGDLPLPPNVRDICAADRHSCALIDNEVHCWGENESGQLGADPSSVIRSTARSSVRTAFDSHVSRLSCGGANTCVTLHNGELYCWGRQWKNASREAVGVPGTVGGLCEPRPDMEQWFPMRKADVTNVLEVAVGANHVCAMTSENKIRCWGSNCTMETLDPRIPERDSTTTMRFGPVVGSEAIALDVNRNTSCALVEGEAHCWGRRKIVNFPADLTLCGESIVDHRFAVDFTPTNILASDELVCLWNEQDGRCFGHVEEWTLNWIMHEKAAELRFSRALDRISEVTPLHAADGVLFGRRSDGALVARVVALWKDLAPIGGLQSLTPANFWEEVELTNFKPRPLNAPPAVIAGQPFRWDIDFANDGDTIRFNELTLPSWLTLEGTTIRGTAPTTLPKSIAIEFYTSDGLHEVRTRLELLKP